MPPDASTVLGRSDPATIAPPDASDRAARVARILGVAALVVVLLVLVWRSLPLVMDGLSSADDAFFAEWAKAVGQGRGYGAPMTWDTSRLFDPTMGGGPALLLPMTGVLLLSGPQELLPGGTTLLVFVVQLMVMVALLGRRFGLGSAAGYGALLVTALLVATAGFFLFGKYLGEPWTLGFLLIGAAALLSGDRRALVATGAMALSLAYLTKQVGAFGAAGIALVWMIATFRTAGLRAGLRQVGLFLVALAALPVAWELVKLASLGSDGYVKLTIEAITLGREAGGLRADDPVATAIDILEGSYLAPLVLVSMGVISVVVLLALRRGRAADPRRAVNGAGLLALMLWAAALGQLVYFLSSRSDWPRYLWLTVALVCAAALAPFLACSARLRAGVLVAGLLAGVVLGAFELPADPLASSPLSAERASVVAWLDARPDLPYATVKWSSIYDVLFPRRDEGRWVMEVDLRSLARQDFAYLVNRAFTDDQVAGSPLHRTALERCPPAIEGERLVVLSCGEAFWTAYLGSPGPSGPVPGAAEAVPSDLLGSADLFAPGSASALRTVDEVPPDGTGTSVAVALDGLPATTRSFAQRRVRLDATDLAADGVLTGWVRASTLDHLDAVFLVLFAGESWIAFPVTPDEAGAWQEIRLPLASPAARSGDFDWAGITAVYLRTDAAADGPYTGEILWHGVGLRPGEAP